MAQNLGKQLIICAEQGDRPELASCGDPGHFWNEPDSSLSHGGREVATLESSCKGLQQVRASKLTGGLVKLVW